jgi:uncharacterized membrane protein YqhA
MVAVGNVRGLHAYGMILAGPPWSGEHRPGIYLAESIDAFLVAMVFIVFSIGTTTLFIAREGDRSLENVPRWMRVGDLVELKYLIWEAILTAMVVAAAAGMIVAGGDPSWAMLILPGAVVLLALGLYLTRRSR